MKVLAAGSAIYGLRAAVAAAGAHHSIAVATDHGHDIHRSVIEGRCDADIVIIPSEMIDDLDMRGLIDCLWRRLGWTGIGYCVRSGETPPVLDGEDSLRAAVIAADKILLTTAPTGEHMRGWLEEMGLADALSAKLLLYGRATDMLAALAQGMTGALAFGPTSELLAWSKKGIAYGGSMPREFDVRVAYDAAVLTTSAHRDEARELLDYLAGPDGLRHFRDSGVE